MLRELSKQVMQIAATRVNATIVLNLAKMKNLYPTMTKKQKKIVIIAN